ncbi:MAG: type IX secretion system membrane protein PorP/SprF [Bacteroidales bacterium]|jgi:hypothetical protein|nr:type IX secretion system membrane protein PorP/SprF [Bacteroidales bacterium]
MKKILLFFCFIAMGISFTHAQSFQLRGLEIYNPAYTNPAFVKAEKTVQLDFIGQETYYHSEIWTNAMVSLPKYNSSAGIQFTRGGYKSSYSPALPVSKSIVYNSLMLSYAYSHSFSDDFKLNGGIAFNGSRLNFLNQEVLAGGEIRQSRKSGTLGLGVSIEYKKLYAGISTDFELNPRVEYLMSDKKIDVRKLGSRISSIDFLAGFDLGGRRRVTFDPVFGVLYTLDSSPQFRKFHGYLGGNIKIADIVGVGITIGNLVSFSTSINIMDRVNLMLGIYAGEYDFFENSTGGLD